MLVIILWLFALLIFVNPIIAVEPPNQVNPANSSVVSSSTLNWQIPSYQLYSSNPYRVQIDDDPSFSPASSIYRDTYKSNTTYTPQLTSGTWYWRVKARDTSGTWSNWSDVWSFTLGNSTPTPTLSPTPSPTPTPTHSSTPQPTSSFIISNIPSQINSDQSFTVSVNLTSNTAYYCKGAFKKAASSNYFGLTLVSGNWIKNGSSYSSQYLCTNNFNLEVKPDIDDPGYTGSGDYIFKVGSYDKDGGNLSWSNEVTIKINNVGNDTLSDSSTPQPTADINFPTSPLPTITKAPTSKPKQTFKYSYQIASVAAATASATPAGKVEVKNQKQTNPLLWVGLIFIFAGASVVVYIYLKRHAKIPF